MDSKAFRKIVNDLFVNHGLEKVGVGYYNFGNDLITVIGLQRSSYSNVYYINVGYVLKEIWVSTELPKPEEGDIRARFGSLNESSQYTLESLDGDWLTANIESNLKQYAQIASVDDLRLFIERLPMLLLQTTLRAKTHLGLV